MNGSGSVHKRSYEENLHPGYNSPEKEIADTDLNEFNTHAMAVTHSGLTDIIKKVRIQRETEIIPLDETTVPNFLKSKFQKIKLAVAEAIMPDASEALHNKIANSAFALRQASQTSAPLDDRILMYPVRASNCASGCYFLKNMQGRNTLVVKPSSQESGNVFCPVPTGKDSPGIIPGQGVLREWLAWKIQTMLGVDLGIPETTLIEMRHPYFLDHKTSPVFNALKQLNAHVSIKNGQEWTEIEFLKCLRQAQGLLPAVTELVLNRDRGALTELHLGADFVGFCQNNEPPARLADVQTILKDKFPAHNWKQLFPLWNTLFKQKGMEEAVSKVYEELVEKRQTAEPALVSAQEYMPGYECDLESAEGVEQISQSEFWKLVIDLILFNCDRHTGNILVKDKKLLLIDHGMTLPDPLFNEGGKGIKNPTMEYLHLPQVNSPVEGPIKEAILHLNISQFLPTLEAEVKEVQARFPKYEKELSLTRDHFTFLSFSLRFLQKGLSQGRTLKAMAMDYADGKAQAILAASLNGNQELDKLLLESLLNKL